MNLNALKAQRKGLRTAFSNCLKKIESELAQELCNFETLSVLKIQLNDKFARMDSCQNAISETFLLSDDGEHFLFAEDLEDAEIYREKFWELTTKIELKSQQYTKIEKLRQRIKCSICYNRWSQGPKQRLVLSFPASAANYPKAIDQLKERFGREDLLVQIYVRDLLTLVMKNAATGRAKADLPLLYDELESKLRSLESLGKTQDKYGDFLTPLVESGLPEEVLVAWERSRNHRTESEGSRSLEQLMNFSSARGERRGDGSFGTDRPHPHQNPRKKDYHATQVNKVETTTAAALVNMDNPGQEKLIRAVIDSGSQSTYVSENVITHLKALPLRSETVIHALFGGSETKPKKHDIFPVEEFPVLLKLKNRKLSELSLNDFNNRIKILPDGRYEVELPWKYDSLKLPSNKELVWKRHEGMINRFGCFNLRGFESNVAGKNVDRSSGDTSVLGVIWNLETDTLKCCTDMDTLTCETKITKRLILAIVQKIFDPIGLLTPATLLPKLLIQHLWKMKIAWDSELSSNDVNVFLKWFRDLYVLKDVTLSRCMIINSTSELHVFVDASKEAYAACVFVRSMFKSDVKVTLVRAKARVAPLKPLSIPRLELMACCIGSRLANSIVNALNLPNLRITFWSDSTTALWWIKEKGSWSVFVENRVKEIRQLTRGHLWKHVPGNLNIADLLSRGCSQQMLISRWWEGPLWLRESPEYWPLGETPGDSEEVELERKKLKVVNIDLSRDAPPWHFSILSSVPTPLPPDRVTDCAPFEIVGIDLAGPLFLKDGRKVWITLFTCAVYRAIHLELVNSLTSDAFLVALRCFIARRGRPRTIYCDNGTNFRGAFNDLSKLNWSKIVEETRTQKYYGNLSHLLQLGGEAGPGPTVKELF
ncbi:integrase catalytic domain-containing protein [Trichonephila clavipes]|nr:integrase catalytic domain-containing protein [Trichonephila clavipes]